MIVLASNILWIISLSLSIFTSDTIWSYMIMISPISYWYNLEIMLIKPSPNTIIIIYIYINYGDHLSISNQTSKIFGAQAGREQYQRRHGCGGTTETAESSTVAKCWWIHGFDDGKIHGEARLGKMAAIDISYWFKKKKQSLIILSWIGI